MTWLTCLKVCVDRYISADKDCVATSLTCRKNALSCALLERQMQEKAHSQGCEGQDQKHTIVPNRAPTVGIGLL